MSKDIQIPDYLKDMMENTSAPKTDDMMSGGMSVPRISLKGGKFRFKSEGEEVEVVKDNLDCVIVGMMPTHGTAKTYYEGVYDSNSSDPPNCSSSDGISPDSWVSNPVSQTCATCPNNKFGSAISIGGKKSKACRDSKRLYIVKAKDMKESERPPYWLLNVTVSSLKPLNNYSTDLKKAGITTPSVVISRLGFDDDADYPKLTFELLGILNKDMVKTSLKIAEEKEWDNFSSTTPALPSGGNKQALPSVEVIEPEAEKPSKVSSEEVDNILESWD